MIASVGCESSTRRASSTCPRDLTCAGPASADFARACGVLAEAKRLVHRQLHSDVATRRAWAFKLCRIFTRHPGVASWHTECNAPVEDMHMAKSTSVAELHPEPRAVRGESKPRKRTPGALARRVEAAGAELSALPMKPLLIGAGIGAALLGSALVARSKRSSLAAPFSGMNQMLTKTALVALARVVSGQTMRSVATSALLDVADSLKS
jgi:hypothetical protein